MTAQTISGVGAEVLCRTGIDPAARVAGTSNGVGIDRMGFNSCVLIGKAGAVTGAPSALTADFKLQHADTLAGSYADYTPTVPSPGGTGAVAVLNAVSSIKKRTIDLKAARRFIRVFCTVGFTGGTAPTLFSDATLVLGGADTLPTTADET